MLKLRGLGKDYGTVEALSEVSLAIGEGEFFSLLGPSGCGKTTLLRLLAGFEAPDRGGIWLEGARIDRLPANRRSFNLVFQRYALFPHLDVFENIAFGLRMKRVPGTELRMRVQEAMSLVRLKGFERRRIATLSGGQQQRVALARAIVNRPRVLLLDEPLSALDLKLRQQMQVELHAIQRRLGLTFVFVTHDQEEALTLSTRIAVMNAGKLEQVGTPREIYEKPATEFVARFIGSVNRIDGRVNEWKGREVRVARGQTIFAAASAGSAAPLPFDTPVSILIRPEKLRLFRAEGARSPATPAPGINHLEGTIHEILYQGASVSFLVQPRDAGIGLITVVRIGDPSPAESIPALAPGDRVRIEWDRDDARLLDPRLGSVLG